MLGQGAGFVYGACWVLPLRGSGPNMVSTACVLLARGVFSDLAALGVPLRHLYNCFNGACIHGLSWCQGKVDERAAAPGCARVSGLPVFWSEW